jgi:hypothetical protein
MYLTQPIQVYNKKLSKSKKYIYFALTHFVFFSSYIDFLTIIQFNYIFKIKSLKYVVVGSFFVKEREEKLIYKYF